MRVPLPFILAALLSMPVIAGAAPLPDAKKQPAAAPSAPASHPITPPAVPQKARASAASSGNAGGPQALRAAIGAGSAKDAIRRLLLKPYADATATELGDAAWDGAADTLAKAAGDHLDLALVDGPTLAAGCTAQMFRKLDWNRLGRARFLPGAASDCGAGAALSATVLAWDREKLQASDAQGAQPEPAPGWTDFWDVAKHPGRRGLQKGARGNLEIALLADGVAAGDVYRTLRTPDGLDRAFRKLDQLKPYILWWDQPGQPASLLGTGKVLLTSAPSASIATASWGTHPRPGVQWNGSLAEWKSWAIPQSAQHEGASAQAILVATDPARMAELARVTALGPSTTDGADLLAGDLRDANPSTAANRAGALQIDEGFWAENHAALETRFAAWLAH